MNRLRDGDAVTAVGLATRPLMRAAAAAAVAAPPPRDDEDAERAGARDEECIACSCIFLSRRIEKGGGARKAASFSFRSNWERGGKKWQESSSSSPSRRLTVRNRKKNCDGGLRLQAVHALAQDHLQAPRKPLPDVRAWPPDATGPCDQHRAGQEEWREEKRDLRFGIFNFKRCLCALVFASSRRPPQLSLSLSLTPFLPRSVPLPPNSLPLLQTPENPPLRCQSRPGRPGQGGQGLRG